MLETTNAYQQTSSNAVQSPKVLELNLSKLSGASRTTKLSPKSKSTIVAESPIKSKPITHIKPTRPIDPNVIEGAAGLWAKNEDQAQCFKAEEEPKAVPPPVTEEDWEIFKKFMVPAPESCYNKLLEMNESDLVPSPEEFVCSICENFITAGKGVVLKGCLHNFCRQCLITKINLTHDSMGIVKCPFPLNNCDSTIADEEIKALLGDDYNFFAGKIMEMLEATIKAKENEEEEAKNASLIQLLDTDNHDFIENKEEFECAICFTDILIGEGVTLKNCLHKFCKLCIIETVKHSDDFVVKCPFSDGNDSCELTLQDREVRGLVPQEIFDKHLEKSLKLYEGASENAYHCKTPDCRGFIEVDQNVRGFTCQVCSKVNCCGCKAIHQGKNCQEYQDEINPDGKHQRENAESENAIRNMIETGEAMYCPQCGIPVMKQEGCDFIMCTTCKLGICWVTKKPRMPLKKNGVVIDGCHCKENGAPCHPNCRHCH